MKTFSDHSSEWEEKYVFLGDCWIETREGEQHIYYS